jgi:uncharacterized membrane protein (TIGR02234 family)
VSRRSAVLLLLLLGGLALLSAVPTWLTSAGSTALSAHVPVAVTGTHAAPGVGAGALVVVAGALALGIVGRIGRYVVLAVTAVAGVVVATSAISVLGDTVTVATTAAADSTGVTELIEPVKVAPWPYVTIVLGFVVTVFSVLVAVFSRGWRTSSRHERAAAAPSLPEPDDDHATWDSLTRGDDPTAGHETPGRAGLPPEP